MNKERRLLWYLYWVILVLAGGGGTLFCWMPRTPMMFGGGIAMLTISAAVSIAILAKTKGKKWLKAGAIGGAIYLAVLAIVTLVCDNVLFPGKHMYASLAITVMNLVFYLGITILIPKKYDAKLHLLKRLIALILVITGFVLSGLPQNYWWGVENREKAALHREATPTGFSQWTEPEKTLVKDADFYVSTTGSDTNDGSFSAPFATIEKAQAAVRAMDKAGKTGITVAIMAGEYRTEGLDFSAEDSGTENCPITYCAYGDGEVIINAGVTLNPADFTKVTDETMLKRLNESVRDKIVCIDLSKMGITTEALGKIYAFGEVHTAMKYDGDYVGGTHCELIVNDKRQVIARYPNGEWAYTGEVLEEGEPQEKRDNPHVKVEGWDELRNPKGDLYALNQEIADRMNSWQDLDEVWMLGYWSCSWGYATTLIENFDYENKTMLTKFVARYGANPNAEYYYFNVFEELDTAGEWYLDRENCILYMYEPENMATASIELTIAEDTLISVENANYLTFSGFTLQGTRGDAVAIKGNNITVEYCLIHNVGNNGVIAEGYNNLIANNEVTRTGGRAIDVTGGVQETLTPGNNRIYNNVVHDWGQVQEASGISLTGVGNKADHNEVYDYVDMGIRYDGSDLIIEYNVIHDIALQSSDSGAIYTGKSYINRGSIVRYNAIYNIGTPGESSPNGIYLDDAVSGQTVYGNLVVNVPDNGILVGGGRDHNIWGNVVINTGNSGLSYDQRTYNGSMVAEYYKVWDSLVASPWQSDIWKEAYPGLAELHKDEAKKDDPLYIFNQANTKVNGNIFINWQEALGNIAETPQKYSNFDGNAIYGLDMLEKIFVDPANGNYAIKEDAPIYEIIPDFQQIPIDQIGRE